MNDWNLEADALAAAPDILVLRRRMGSAWGMSRSVRVIDFSDPSASWNGRTTSVRQYNLTRSVPHFSPRPVPQANQKAHCISSIQCYTIRYSGSSDDSKDPRRRTHLNSRDSYIQYIDIVATLTCGSVNSVTNNPIIKHTLMFQSSRPIICTAT
jgi:hypothetical protein